MANEYVNKVVLGSSTLIDLTADTVTPSTLMQGYTAHDKSGAAITGTATGNGAPVFELIMYDDYSDVKSITCDKTYAECLYLATTYSADVNTAALIDQNDESGSFPIRYAANVMDVSVTPVGNTMVECVRYTSVNGEPYIDIIYYEDGTIGWNYPSSLVVEAGIPTATKGAVSNHSVSVTPSVTNTAGFIKEGTKTGTAVTVSASELVSGSETKTENGTYDVTNLASVTVNVPSGGVDIPTFTVTWDSSWSTVQSVTCDKTRTECAELYFDSGYEKAAALVVMTDGTGSYYITLTGNATLMNRSGQLIYAVFECGYGTPSFDLEYNTDESINFVEPSHSSITKNITANGTYTPPNGYVWSSVMVNVPTSTPTLQAKTATPATSQQIITADSGYDGLSQVTVSAMPSGTAGTPSATKGSVSNHSVTVTPSVTNSTGYITGGTKTGTAVTVSASELVSGSETKTANGTYNVTNLASLVVDIPFVTYHTSSSAPTSSQGSDGDLWLVTA